MSLLFLSVVSPDICITCFLTSNSADVSQITCFSVRFSVATLFKISASSPTPPLSKFSLSYISIYMNIYEIYIYISFIYFDFFLYSHKNINSMKVGILPILFTAYPNYSKNNLAQSNTSRIIYYGTVGGLVIVILFTLLFSLRQIHLEE